MNKQHIYYTPDIEEFYDGFQYEEEVTTIDTYSINSQEELVKEVTRIRERGLSVYGAKINWTPAIYKFQDQVGPARVKYLDSDDLRECGFRVGDLPWQYFDGIHMLVDVGYNLISITHIADDQGLFYGEIKNFSEFKKLLKQLDIRYDRG